MESNRLNHRQKITKNCMISWFQKQREKCQVSESKRVKNPDTMKAVKSLRFLNIRRRKLPTENYPKVILKNNMMIDFLNLFEKLKINFDKNSDQEMLN